MIVATDWIGGSLFAVCWLVGIVVSWTLVRAFDRVGVHTYKFSRRHRGGGHHSKGVPTE